MSCECYELVSWLQIGVDKRFFGSNDFSVQNRTETRKVFKLQTETKPKITTTETETLFVLSFSIFAGCFFQLKIPNMKITNKNKKLTDWWGGIKVKNSFNLRWNKEIRDKINKGRASIH